MTSQIIDDIFPDSSQTVSIPCGAAGCVSATIEILLRDSFVINQEASNAAVESLRENVNNALTALEATTIDTIRNSVILVAINIYIPIFLILIIIVWVLCAAGVIGSIVAIVLTILLIIIGVIFIFLIRSSISSYLAQQLDVITDALSDYIISDNFISALNTAACVYNSIAGGSSNVSLSVRNCSTCKNNNPPPSYSESLKTSSSRSQKSSGGSSKDVGDIDVFY